jgi:hypothetical protein
LSQAGRLRNYARQLVNIVKLPNGVMRFKVPSLLIFRSLTPAQIKVAMRWFWIRSVWIACLVYVVLAWVLYFKFVL